MNCPHCKTKTLERTELPGAPVTQRCTTCAGRWLAFDDHLRWVEAGRNSQVEVDAPEPVAAPTALSEIPSRARLCPRCGKIMGRFRVRADSTLTLDRCGSCSGIWFDAAEWEQTAAVVPLARVQHLFNDSYQRRLSLELARRSHEAHCRGLVGDEAYERAVSFRDWVNTHPRADVLRAIVNDDQPQ